MIILSNYLIEAILTLFGQNKNLFNYWLKIFLYMAILKTTICFIKHSKLDFLWI